MSTLSHSPFSNSLDPEVGVHDSGVTEIATTPAAARARLTASAHRRATKARSGRSSIFCIIGGVALLVLPSACGGEHGGDPWPSELPSLSDAGTERVLATRTVRIAMPNGELEERVAVVHDDGKVVIDGDIIARALDDAEDDGAKDGIGVQSQALAAWTAGLWPGGTVPYEIAASAAHRRGDVEWAVKRWNDQLEAQRRGTTFPRVWLRPKRSSDTSWVRVERASSGCVADVGRRSGPSRISISDRCDRTSIAHELGHSLGLYHTQTRSDRDDHVRVNWENIQAGYEGAFQTYRERGYTSSVDVGSYRTDSLMHYGSYAFSRNGRPTLEKKGGGTIGGGRDVTSNDARFVLRLYERYGGP